MLHFVSFHFNFISIWICYRMFYDSFPLVRSRVQSRLPFTIVKFYTMTAQRHIRWIYIYMYTLFVFLLLLMTILMALKLNISVTYIYASIHIYVHIHYDDGGRELFHQYKNTMTLYINTIKHNMYVLRVRVYNTYQQTM